MRFLVALFFSFLAFACFRLVERELRAIDGASTKGAKAVHMVALITSAIVGLYSVYEFAVAVSGLSK